MDFRCQDCGKVDKNHKSGWEEKNECDCGGSYAELGGDDDGYEPTECPNCEKDMGKSDTYSCGECSEDVCEECNVDGLENVTICKQCVDGAYPRKIEPKIEYKEKVVEKPVNVYVDKDGTPISNSFNPLAKSKFD